MNENVIPGAVQLAVDAAVKADRSTQAEEHIRIVSEVAARFISRNEMADIAGRIRGEKTPDRTKRGRALSILRSIENGKQNHETTEDLIQFILCEFEFTGAEYRKTEKARCVEIAEWLVDEYYALHKDECQGGNELHSPYAGPLDVAKQMLAKIRGDKCSS